MDGEIGSRWKGVWKGFKPEMMRGRYGDGAFEVTGPEESKQAGRCEARLGNCKEMDPMGA